MTDEEIDGLTLGDLKRIAARSREAYEDLSKVRGLFGGVAPSVAPAAPVAVEPARKEPQLSPERQKALDEWRNSPSRARLTEQMKNGTGAGDEEPRN